MIVKQSDGQTMIYPNRLLNDKAGCQTLKQLGFKIIYAKITKANLMNQVGFIKT